MTSTAYLVHSADMLRLFYVVLRLSGVKDYDNIAGSAYICPRCTVTPLC